MEENLLSTTPVTTSTEHYCCNSTLVNPSSPARHPFPSESNKNTTDVSHARNVFREQFALEVSYKEEELEIIEERIQLAKMLLQRLRLGILAQHYGAAAFCSTTLDYREENIGTQGSWESFEDQFMNMVAGKGSGETDEKNKIERVEDQEDLASEGCNLGTVESSSELVKKELLDEEVPIQLSVKRMIPRVKETTLEEKGVEEAGVGEKVTKNDDTSVEVIGSQIFSKRLSPAAEDGPEVEGGEEGHMSRFYIKRRVIVGNTSQYLDPIAHQHVSADGSTHKWMVYVRGPQSEPDISDFVKGVRFFLHPSYHPNDIVRVKTPPFHLTRHGWGEFPIRVQLEFKDRRNKPVDILHNLVLDRTHTGQQTLGAETVVDLDLALLTTEMHQYNGIVEGSVGHLPGEKLEVAVRRPQQTLSSTSSSSMTSSIASREQVSLPSSMDPQPMLEEDVSLRLVPKSPSPEAMEEACSEISESSAQAKDDVGVAPSVGNVITTNLDKCLHTAVRGIPICSKTVVCEDFHVPAPSLTQFRLWNIGRRRATEWVRAVAVRKSIQRKLHLCQVLSTRRVMVWCRQNGYTPLDPAPESGRGFCKICGRQLGEEGVVEESEDEEEKGVGLDEEDLAHRRKNLEVHDHCHSKLFGPGSYLREGFFDLNEDFQVSNFSGGEEKSRPKLSLLGRPDALMEQLLSLEQQLRGKEKKREEVLDTTGLPPSPSCARTRALVDMVPRFRVPQTPELKWIQVTASSIGIKIFPAVIDRMYAHVVEHMIYISCTRFLRGILGQAIQGAWQGEEGGLSQDRVLTPFHLQQAIIQLEHCDFLTNCYLGATATPSEGAGFGTNCGSVDSSSSCASSDEDED